MNQQHIDRIANIWFKLVMSFLIIFFMFKIGWEIGMQEGCARAVKRMTPRGDDTFKGCYAWGILR